MPEPRLSMHPGAASLPTGTVTFLFTDIQGSTPLWEQMPDVMRAAVALHHAILRRVIEANGGQVFQIQGDAFQAAFPLARQGLNAAIEAQRELRSAEWGPTGLLKVRMGLHVGPAELDPIPGPGGMREYSSNHTLNRSARVMSAGHGGQILLSQEAADLTARSLPEGVRLADKGEYRLKGMQRTEHLYQAVVPGLPQEFPPLSGGNDHPNNLPLQLTSFIGREKELAAIAQAMENNRLLTLTGPGGSGKTRLALEAAAQTLKLHPDGSWLVDMTQTRDSKTVVKLVAQALGIVILGDSNIEKVIRDYLQNRHLLLIFDNCEHVVDEAARLCLALLSACPGVSILATSQVHLDVPGEQEWLIPTLPLPDQDQPLPPLEELRQFDAVQLFVERAKASLPDFRLTGDNAATVVHICRHLDGIPLAIELAAARIKLFSINEIAARLDSRFGILAAPRRLVYSRHQTLQAAIDWSFNLLNDEEQLLLSRLAVFTGSFTMNAVEIVCGFDPLQPSQIIDLFANLVDRSLVSVNRSEGQENRYRLLESVRMYGLARLSEEERNLLKDQHLNYYAHLASLYNEKHWGPSQIEWTNRLEAEWINIHAAANWVLEAQSETRLYQGIQLLADLERFFFYRNHIQEPVHWMQEMLARVEKNDDPDGLAAQAKGHHLLGIILFFQHYAISYVFEQIETSRNLWRKLGTRGRHGYAFTTLWMSQLEHLDLSKADQYLQECREIFQAEKDPVGMSFVLLQEGQLAERMNHLLHAEAKFRELHSYANQIGIPFFVGFSIACLDGLLQKMDRNEEALVYLNEAMEVFQQLGSQRLVVMTLTFVTEAHIALGNLEQAQELIEQTAAIQERMDIQFNSADMQYNRGEIALLKSKYETAAAFFRRSSREHYIRRFWPGFYEGCLGLAASVAEEDPAFAARMYGFAQKTAGSMHELMYHERTKQIITDRLNIARDLLGEAAFERALAEGAACTLDDLIPAEDGMQ